MKTEENTNNISLTKADIVLPEVIDSKEIAEVTVDFTNQLNELDKAILQTKDAKNLAAKVKEKGWWSTLGGGITGSNDKELAESVKQLGTSVETTQKILGIVLKVNHAKNQFLKSFHCALTEKILQLEDETEICDENQRDAKEATKAIALQLRAQIEDKLKQAEMIEDHEEKIKGLSDSFRIKDELDQKQSLEIDSLKKDVKSKEILDNEQSQEIQNLVKIAEHKSILDNTQSAEIEKLKKTVSILNAQLDKQIRNFIDYVESHNTLPSRIKRLALPFVSLLLALVSLILNFL